MFNRRYAYEDQAAYDGRAAAAARDQHALESRLSAARVVQGIASLVVGVIVLAIVLIVLDANQSNGIVNAVTDVGRWLTTPFRDIFSVHDHHWRVVVNWGLAAVVYSAIANFIARMIVR